VAFDGMERGHGVVNDADGPLADRPLADRPLADRPRADRPAVIGAGPAGLAAAWTLAEAGLRPVLYDAAPRAGGMLRTDQLDGVHVDVGVQLVGSPHTALFDLARRAGAGSLLRKSPGHDALWRRGRAHGITYGSVASMVASGALPMTLKLKLASRYVPFLKTQARRLDVNDPAGSGGAEYDDESIGAWGRRELGDDFVELLVYPLLAAYYGALPEETGAGIYHALARAGMDVSVYGVAGGFGALADALVTALEARGAHFELGSAVRSVRALRGGGVLVDGERFAGAVVAVAANRAAALLDAEGELAAWLDGVVERSALTVAYRLDRAAPGDWFGLSFPRTTEPGRRIAVACAMSRKLPGLVPQGGDAVVVLPAPHALPGLLSRSDDDVAATLLADLDSVLPGIGRRVRSHRVYRHDDAYTVFGPGHVKRLLRYDASWLPPGVALAGDYLVAPTVEGAVRSGIRAAARVLETRPG
jgi:protoporphyrinogen/coproporphyrinogen III oxidase